MFPSCEHGEGQESYGQEAGAWLKGPSGQLVSPEKGMLESLTPGPQNTTLLGDKVFKWVLKA